MREGVDTWKRLELNSGRIGRNEAGIWRLQLQGVSQGYADAQLDDYHGLPRSEYKWHPGTALDVTARFSHNAQRLVGTAGFGFWNAPFGPGTGVLPALPQAVWFFYASKPGDLPLAAVDVPGRGWFASTVDASSIRALSWAPVAPFVLLANQFATLRRRLWPRVRRSLQISFASVEVEMREWHHYHLRWQSDGVFFEVDGQPLLYTPSAVRGPLGFVCWIDNQYLKLTPRGGLGWGTLPVSEQQWLEIKELRFDRLL